MKGIITTRLVQQWGQWYIELMLPKRTSGVYAIQNIANGRAYIGSSVDIRQRWTAHISELKFGQATTQMKSDWTLYGPGAFELIVLERIADPTSVSLMAAEQRWLDDAQRAALPYNARLKVRRSDWNTQFGHSANDLTSTDK